MNAPRWAALPRIGLGCATLGVTRRGTAEDAAVAMVKHALARGVRLFDTAALYGGGVSEQRLGLALTGIPRGSYLLSTKVGRYRAEGGKPDHFDFSYDHTLRAVDDSLKRLRTDRLDIVHLHDCGNHLAEAMTGAVPTLERLKRENIIAGLGAGLNAVAPTIELIWRADLDALLIAGRFTLLDASAAERLLPLCHERGVAVIAGGVFNSGALMAADPAQARFDYRPLQPAMRGRVLDAVDAFVPPGL